jgi:hypothetical protein
MSTKNQTEKTPKATHDLEEVTTESLERHVLGGSTSGQNRSQINHDKSRQTARD